MTPKRDLTPESTLAELSGNYLHTVKTVSTIPALADLYCQFTRVRQQAEQGQSKGMGVMVFRYDENSGEANWFYLWGDEFSEGGFVDKGLPGRAFWGILDDVLCADPDHGFVLLVCTIPSGDFGWFKVARYGAWITDGERLHSHAVLLPQRMNRFSLLQYQTEMADAITQGELAVQLLTDPEFEALFQRTRIEIRGGIRLPGESFDLLGMDRLESLQNFAHPSLFDGE